MFCRDNARAAIRKPAARLLRGRGCMLLNAQRTVPCGARAPAAPWVRVGRAAASATAGRADHGGAGV